MDWKAVCGCDSVLSDRTLCRFFVQSMAKAEFVPVTIQRKAHQAALMTKRNRTSVKPMDISRRRHVVLLLLLTPMLVIEIVLLGADLGVWGTSLWRSYAYLYGAFRPALLTGPMSFWEGQRFGMFLTHILLHVGPLHFILNAVALMFLGHFALERLRQRAVLLVFFVSAMGGALMFSLVPGEVGVMTGASGGLSGLAAAWGVQSLMAGYTPPRSLAMVLGVIAITTALELGLQDQMAWQAHFGGAVTGAVIGMFLQRKRDQKAVNPVS